MRAEPRGRRPRTYLLSASVQERYLLPLLAIALAGGAAQAETFTYKCGRHTAKMDDKARTITWDGHVFSNGHVVEGGKFATRQVIRPELSVKLSVATKGVASVDLFGGEDDQQPKEFDCQQVERPR